MRVGTGAHRELCLGPYLVRVARLAERVANEFAVAVVASVLALMQLHAEHELAPLQLIVIETTCGVGWPVGPSGDSGTNGGWVLSPIRDPDGGVHMQ